MATNKTYLGDICCGIITKDFVDEGFERSVESLIPKKNRGVKHRNVVMRYGSNYPYDNNIVSKVIPKEFDFLRDVTGFDFDSVTINEYLTGQIINWHIDKGESDIFIISLLSDNHIRFRKREMEIQTYIQRFSLFQMSDDLRLNWEHYLEAQNRRISVVLRKSEFA